MGLRINSNIAALSSYNNLNKTDKAVSSSLEKLSSGYRINKAADDAAGLVVSEGLKSQIGGLTVAARNAQDGVNVAQTADGALSTVTDILQRMRDLAVQASNAGSQDSTAQAAANTEFGQLSKELDRIASTTSFGGQQLLSGSYSGTFQIGANNSVNDRIDVALNSSIFGPAVSGTSGTATSLTFSDANVTAMGLVTGDTVTVSDGVHTFSKTLTTAITTAAGLSTFLGTAGGQFNSVTGGLQETTVGTTSPITLSARSSANVNRSIPTGTAHAGTNNTYGTATGFDSAGLNIGGSASLTSATLARDAITRVDSALANVSSARATLGAIQNRFEKSIDNLNTAIQNITASNSAIRDTDMAAEMTKFTKNQVLAQAGTSMLAQANSSTQNILTLLRG